jgi:hypothetical protein
LISCRDIWYQGYAKEYRPEIFFHFYQGLMLRAKYDLKKDYLLGVHVFEINDISQLDSVKVDLIQNLSLKNRVIISFLSSHNLLKRNNLPLTIHSEKPSNISIVFKDQLSDLLKSYIDLGFKIEMY